MVLVLGCTAWNVILTFVVMDFRIAAMRSETGSQPFGHVSRPRAVCRPMAEKQWAPTPKR